MRTQSFSERLNAPSNLPASVSVFVDTVPVTGTVEKGLGAPCLKQLNPFG
jgi:hypothetical protein